MSTINCNPLTLIGGGTSSCQITLTGAAVANSPTISLTSSSTQVSVPPVLQPVAGSTTVPFTVTSSLIDHDDSAVLIANMGATSAQATISLLGLKPTALACPQTLQSGLPLSCQVTLNSGQATTSVPIAISGNGQLVTLPASVPSVSGQSTVTFQGNTTYVSSDQSVTVSATYHAIAVQASVTLTPAPPVLTVPGRQTITPGGLVTFTVSANDPAGLTVVLSVANLPPDSSFNPNTGVFSWSPTTSQVGQYSVAFTATNSAQVSATQDVAIEVQSTTPIISSLTNAASFVNAACSPGAVATLLGTGFVATGAKSAEVSPLPTTIDGLHVQGNGSDLPVFYVSEDQVNFQCPQGAPGSSVSLKIQSGTGASAPLATTMQLVAPGIFTTSGSGKGQGAVLVAGTANVAMTKTKGVLSQPAPRGGYISIYATGLGATNVDVPAGAPAPTDPLAEVVAPVTVVLGGEPAEVTFAGLVPGYTGLYVVNAKVPATAAIGPAITLEIDVQLPDGTVSRSNVVTIAVAPAGN